MTRFVLIVSALVLAAIAHNLPAGHAADVPQIVIGPTTIDIPIGSPDSAQNTTLRWM